MTTPLPPTPETAWLDGVELPLEPGETILAFIERHRHAGAVPTLCNDARLAPFGSCRVCSVEAAPSADAPRKVVASCHTPVTPGLHIFSGSERITRLRRNILELVLSDYPVESRRGEGPGRPDAELQAVIRKVGIDPAAVRYRPAARRDFAPAAFDPKALRCRIALRVEAPSLAIRNGRVPLPAPRHRSRRPWCF